MGADNWDLDFRIKVDSCAHYTAQSSIQDEDNDTKIQVEKTTDEDIIHFDIAGSEAMVIDNNRNVGIGTSSPDGSAMLDVKSTDKGMLVPRMTSAQRTGISSPATGLLVFDMDNASFWYYDGSSWADLSAASASLDDAYNNGSTITADAGAVTITGTDGLISTGTIASGASLPVSGAGTRMMWYPKKAAFRAGYVDANTMG